MKKRKPYYKIVDGVVVGIVPLTCNKEVMIDAEDLPFIGQWNWCYHNEYAIRNNAKGELPTQVFMHRILNKTPNGFDTDHVDRDKLNNRKCNLRTCTRSQNKKNCSPRGVSKYVGVSWINEIKKWRVSIRINGKKTHVGSYANELEAAKAYNDAASFFYGEYASINVL